LSLVWVRETQSYQKAKRKEGSSGRNKHRENAILEFLLIQNSWVVFSEELLTHTLHWTLSWAVSLWYAPLYISVTSKLIYVTYN
jgi:hypothetical protein